MNRNPNQRRYDVSTDRQLGGFRRDIVAVLGFLLVLFNLVGVGLLSHGTGMRMGRALDVAAGDLIEICTSTGIVLVDRDGTPVKSKVGEDLCAFCLPLLNGKVDIPVPLPVVRGTKIAAQSLEYSIQASLAPSASPDLRANAPRGPPFA